MKRLVKVIAVLLLLTLVVVGTAAWWFLYSPSMPEPELPGTLRQESLLHDGLERSWVAYYPSRRLERAPLVIVLHGSGGDSGQVLRGGGVGLNLLAEREGFIAVYPDGFEGHWNDCRGSADYSANTMNIDDVGFFRALVARMVTKEGADPAQVYVAGFSNGGHMAYKLALEAPDLVTAVAPIIANLPVPDNLDCEPREQGLPVLIINGTEDPINPYEGGVVNLFGNASRGEVMSATETATYWASLAGYKSEGERRDWPDADPDDGTSIRSTVWAANGKPTVALVTVVGGGHTSPLRNGRAPRILGRTSHEFDTAELVWAFFSRGELSPGNPMKPRGSRSAHPR